MISKINEILLELKTRESKVMKEKKAVITLSLYQSGVMVIMSCSISEVC